MPRTYGFASTQQCRSPKIWDSQKTYPALDGRVTPDGAFAWPRHAPARDFTPCRCGVQRPPKALPPDGGPDDQWHAESVADTTGRRPRCLRCSQPPGRPGRAADCRSALTPRSILPHSQTIRPCHSSQTGSPARCSPWGGARRPGAGRYTPGRVRHETGRFEQLRERIVEDDLATPCCPVYLKDCL